MIATALALSQAARRNPWTVVAVVGALVVSCGLSWAWGYSVGSAGVPAAIAAERQAQTTATAKEVEAAQEQYREAVRQGEQAAGQLRTQLAKRDRRITNLEREAKHAPTLISSPACPAPGAALLSVGAVRLYDAAIGGADQQLSASACGAAGGADGTGAAGAGCEQPSKVTAARLYQVAQHNAELHGECMTRLINLVSFLESRAKADVFNAGLSASNSE